LHTRHQCIAVGPAESFMPFHADRIASVLLMLSLICVCGRPSIVSLTQAVFLSRATRHSAITLPPCSTFFSFGRYFGRPLAVQFTITRFATAVFSLVPARSQRGSKDRSS
jgi:hypothetical protein